MPELGFLILLFISYLISYEVIKKMFKKVLIILLLISLTIGFVSAADPIKVAVYTGNGVATDDLHLKPYWTALEEYNHNHSDNQVCLYKLGNIQSLDQLNGYDALLVPGGNSGKYANGLSKSVVQDFVRSGHGYVGVCAGAFYAAISYNGPAVVALHINTTEWRDMDTHVGVHDVTGEHPEYTGNWQHRGGPIMTVAPGGRNLAYYDDVNNYGAAVVQDWYGSGSVILFSSHPESDQYGGKYRHTEAFGNSFHQVTNT
jgi:glutamine amidotransferase-like uncharacterized protein